MDQHHLQISQIARLQRLEQFFAGVRFARAYRGVRSRAVSARQPASAPGTRASRATAIRAETEAVPDVPPPRTAHWHRTPVRNTITARSGRLERAAGTRRQAPGNRLASRERRERIEGCRHIGGRARPFRCSSATPAAPRDTPVSASAILRGRHRLLFACATPAALLAASFSARLLDRYGMMRSSTAGSSWQGTSSRSFVPAFASGPERPPTNTSTASTISSPTFTFFPSSPMSAVEWFPHPAGHPDQCIVRSFLPAPMLFSSSRAVFERELLGFDQRHVAVVDAGTAHEPAHHSRRIVRKLLEQSVRRGAVAASIRARSER